MRQYKNAVIVKRYKSTKIQCEIVPEIAFLVWQLLLLVLGVPKCQTNENTKNTIILKKYKSTKKQCIIVSFLVW